MITIINNVYNVSNYGAVGDGLVDDSAAIQAAINSAKDNKGGIVWLPPGTYLIENSLNLEDCVQLLGSNWRDKTMSKGSYLYFKSAFTGNAINVWGNGSEIRDIAISCEQPNPENEGSSWVPNEFGNGWAINVQSDNVRIESVHLYNVTRGIKIHHGGGGIGKVRLNGVSGQPLKKGIEIDNALDIVRVENVHFWPFWSQNDHVKKYQLEHAIGLLSYRNDNPFYYNIFCLHYSVGMLFSTSGESQTTGHTSKFKIVNADLDFCATGIKIDANNTTGQVSNYSCHGPNINDVQSDVVYGIHIDAANVNLQASNLHIKDVHDNAIRIDQSSSLSLENIWLENWDNSKDDVLQTYNNSPGIYAVSGATVYLGAGRVFNNNHVVDRTGGGGTFNIAQYETGS